MDEIVQSILDENDLVVKQIPEGHFSLMRAISNCLYFTSINYKQIQEQCIRFLKQMIDQKKLPEKLNQFKNSITLYNDFISDPNKFDYHKVNLELVSLLFQTKIQVYYINEENQLLSFIVNNRYKRKIEMIYTNNHYDPVFSRKFIQLITISQQIVQKIIDQSLEVNGKTQEKFVNYEYENWFVDRIMQLNEINSLTQINQCDTNGGTQQQYTRFKRSLSDNYNVNYVLPQEMSQQQLNQVPNQFGIIEENDESSNQNEVKDKENNNNTKEDLKKQNKTFAYDSEKQDQNKFESNVSRAKTTDNANPPKLDISQAQTFERKPIISPIYFVKSNPPGISPKPNNVNTNTQRFDWKNQDDSNEDSIIEEKSNGNEQSAQNSLNSSSQGPSSKRGSGKFNAANISANSPTKIKSEKDAPLSQFAQKKPKVVDVGAEKVTGSLKFFDEKKNFGFFVLDSDGSDIFVYFDDLEQAGITKKMLKESVEKKTKLFFKFNCMSYVGKYQNSKKAIDIELIGSSQAEDQDIIQQESNHQAQQNNEQQEDLSNNQPQLENQQISSEQKKKQLSERFAGFSSIIAASQNRKS